MMFRDYFSEGAAAYATFRPRYPAALFAELADRAPRRELAWDAGTGNGQAAVGLAEHFRRVIATDASESQIGAGLAHERIEFRVAPAESSGLASESTDLVTVAQALHWFDVDAFYREAKRVLVPGGVLGVWCYGLMEVDPDVDPLLRTFYAGTLGPYWCSERALVDSGYLTLPFPFVEFEIASLAIQQELTLDMLTGYLGTWSAVRRYIATHGTDPVKAFARELSRWWGSSERRRVRWPLHVRAGYRSGAGA